MSYFKMKRMKMRRILFSFIVLLSGLRSFSQKAYFIDGYHGGIYGHLPSWQTKFMVEKLGQYPDWKINLELEPESWDTIALHDPVAYAAFQKLFADQSSNGRIEYVNPAYGQSYLYNISGESMIRQFYYGMKKLREHFPTAVFSSYSSEEPCFTSALPQILRSYGFKYASLKNPNTCWGGYTRAFGGELVNWIGPDGSSILTSPRYEIEALKPRSIWETIASGNSEEYIHRAQRYGILHPVGMCLQDAGWTFGPWLRGGYYMPTLYETWRGYMENVSMRKAGRDWKLSQEDVLVGLMWGSQILQRIAREVRVSENKIIQAEKLATLARAWDGSAWPGASLDQAWRTLMLSQHHDCWIVPYNGKPGDTWADKVVAWTGNTNSRSEEIMDASVRGLSVRERSEGQGASEASPAGRLWRSAGRTIRVFNTTAVRRKEWVSILLPADWKQGKIIDFKGREVMSQGSGEKQLIFKADVPSMGYASYRLEEGDPSGGSVKAALALRLGNGLIRIETDLYRMLLDPAKGGTIRSWVAKQLGNKEFVDGRSERSFNELRGNFYKAGGFRSSTENPAEILILEKGPAQVKVEIRGNIAGSPFTQVITMQQGQPRVDIHLLIDWKENPAIGEYFESPKDDQVRKAYYDDRYKLLAIFPLSLPSQKVYKNAPFDVTESKLENTFYNRWDSIKNNVLLNWVDVEDGEGRYGMTLLSDHTTSYAHGKDFPLGLTLQYSGNGIFYRDYKISGPLELNYAWIPHAGKWDRAGIWTEGTKWNEPLLARVGGVEPGGGSPGWYERNLLSIDAGGFEISSMGYSGDNLLVRLFNAEGDNRPRKLTLGFGTDAAEEIALNGEGIKKLSILKDVPGRQTVEISMPRFGIRTIKFNHALIK